MRLDKYLVEEGYFESRNRANEAIKAGEVKVNGKPVKASTKVDHCMVVEVENCKFYVSRAARKLEAFLEIHPLCFLEKRVLDIGSSTGGFAQIILEQGAKALSCVDVGRDQLHGSLRDEPRLSLYEEMDIRAFESEVAFDTITCDVSFISIRQIMGVIDSLALIGADIVILYKPQFEVGREVKRDSRGVVQDMDAIARERERFEAEAIGLGWGVVYQADSVVQGKSGNQEYLYHFVKQESEVGV